MLENLDELMTKHGLEAIVIHGESTYHNPEFYFVTRTHIPRGGIYLKKADNDPILIVNEIDLENAKQGVVKRVLSYSEKSFEKLITAHGKVGCKYVFQKLIREEGVAGKIGFYGRAEANANIAIVNSLRKMGYKINDSNSAVLREAMATKSKIEIEAIKMMGKLCGKVILQVLDLLKDCNSNGNKFKFKSNTINVGFIKSAINRFFTESGLLPDEGYILSTGAKTSDPHYPGSGLDLIKRNEPILIDIFPKGAENFYFDMTRTFVIGKANKKLKNMYSAVAEVHNSIMDAISEGTISGHLMNLACEIFEKKGYKTLRRAPSKPLSKNGFIHSLGHGVGWTLSDKPTISLFSKERIETGNVLTVEPGLYNQAVGGVRLEDVLAVNGKGILKLSELEIPFEV